MPALDLVAQIAETIYQLQPQRIEPLPPLLDWRGIYRIHDQRGLVWLLRLLRLPEAAESLTEAGRLLQWLEQQQYPAPHVRTTRSRQCVGRLDGWASLLLTYVDGSVLEAHSTDFALLGHALGRLHALPLPGTAAAARSRCHPDVIQAHTARQLAKGNAAPSLQPLVAALHASLAPIACHGQDLRITHGDCWYKNAIRTADRGVVLIDWDCVGMGLPILDVGYLLLTSHYDLTQPLHVAADTDKIRAILQGYQQARSITGPERALMESAVQFALALHLGSYLEEHAHVDPSDLVIKKTQARFAATTQIAQIAVGYLEQTSG
jgi:Ser/Thr protein kinase RdoA (MazF antagonist)